MLAPTPVPRRTLSVIALLGLILTGCIEEESPTAPDGPAFDHVAGGYVVTNKNDSGEGSLRYAIEHVEPGGTITFDPALNGSTIRLLSGQLTIDKDLTIAGPGSSRLTLDTHAFSPPLAFRVFEVHAGVTASISGLTMAVGFGPWGIVEHRIGGAIYNRGVLTVSAVRVSSNSGEYGAGIANMPDGIMTIRDSEVLNNVGFTGGGIYNAGTLTLISSTVAGNKAVAGGGINNQNGTLIVVNSTISGNTASISGGGIDYLGTAGPSRLTINHSTITANGAPAGGGIYTFMGSTTLRSSVIAANGSNDMSLVNASATVSYTLVGNTSGNNVAATPENGNLVGSSDTPLDPMLGPLVLNAPGTTRTHRLLTGSPAINAGTCTDAANAVVSTDQRAVARPLSSICDMGAYEFDPSADHTPPELQLQIIGTLGANQWYTTNVTVIWHIIEDHPGSVIDGTNCLGGSINADTKGTTFACTATTWGGSTSSSVAIKRDATAPSLSPTISPDPVLLNGAASATPNASDATSGVDTSSCDALNTSTPGSKTVLCTATDKAGNTGTVNASYAVQYAFDGFASPLLSDGMNVVKAGQTVPLKWRLLDANDTPITNLTSAAITVAHLTCAAGSSVDLTQEAVAGKSGLQNLGDGYYQYNWSTPKSYANSCKTMRLDLGEGVFRTAQFQFTK